MSTTRAPDWLELGSYVVLAKDFAPQDGLTFSRGLEGVVVQHDFERTGPSAGERGPYMVVFFREGHLEGDHSWLDEGDLAPDPSVGAVTEVDKNP
ncbi:hypothetical protein ABIE44_000396 [Marmoricola sp. OAE513]|uniref:hypothetical protein n=1 Tax=Marmoricola sp. OAE513 TaxID=2817894 RepID=UPI001AE91A2D